MDEGQQFASKTTASRVRSGSDVQTLDLGITDRAADNFPRPRSEQSTLRTHVPRQRFQNSETHAASRIID